MKQKVDIEIDKWSWKSIYQDNSIRQILTSTNLIISFSKPPSIRIISIQTPKDLRNILRNEIINKD